MSARFPNIATTDKAIDGFIVVVVLWILAMLSALITSYAVYVIDSSSEFAALDDQLRAEPLISAAIELTAYQYLTAEAKSRPSHGHFDIRLGSANITTEFRSESARIDINAAPKAVLVGLFVVLGAGQNDAETYADRIIAWRAAPAQNGSPEAAAYEQARLPYPPRGAKFPHVRELALVRGLPVALLERAMPFITVYSGQPQVNILDAPPEVIAALPGMTRERVKAVLADRQAAPANTQALLAQLGPAAQFATTQSSNALRLFVKIAFDNGSSDIAEIVILTFENGEVPFSVLSWRDDRDELR